MIDFKEIFEEFMSHRDSLKVMSVASVDENGVPNCAPKMLVDIEEPSQIYFLEYKFTQTYKNFQHNRNMSVSFMDDASFIGFRLTGLAEILEPGHEDYEVVKKAWEKRLIGYEADRILQRAKGIYSSREAENMLPQDFMILRVSATEAAVVKPDRILRAQSDSSS